MNAQSPNVSVIDPISPAIERAKLMLFRPFDIGKWFVVGFCAWLAYLGQGGGGGGGSNFNFRGGHRLREVEHELNAAKEFVVANLFWLAPLAITISLVILCIWLLFTWLSSRGHFMLLHCVAENKAEIKVPWGKFRRQANSLFAFRVVMCLISLAVIGVPILVGILALLPMILAGGPAGLLLWIVMLVFAVIIAVVVLAIVNKFTMDFVVPIMFLRTTSCMAAWREFLRLLSENKVRFVLYILFQIVIAIVIGTVIVATICCTCCCACCILTIPYIGTVLLLPIIIFDRSYSLYYLRQFGPEFDVFSTSVELTRNLP
jgi:hypothetical protein